MDISRLTKMHIGILTEDSNPSPNPERLVGNFIKTQTEEGNMIEDDQQDQNIQQPQQEEPQSQEIQQQEQQPQEDEQNPYDVNQNMDDQQDAGMNNQGDQNTDIPDIPDDYDSKDDTPKLKILKSLSDKEYKLNNIRCHEQFKELYRNVENSINNNIIDIVTKNPKQRQVVSFVHNNLSKMLDDLNLYIVYKFSDIYEDNILAYTTFLKRYHIAMKLIELIVKENHEEKEPS